MRSCGCLLWVATALAFPVTDVQAQPAINSLYPPTISERIGDHVAYSVTATASSGTLSYAWHQTSNANVLSTSSALVLTNIQPTNAGAYYVIVTDARGSTTSSNVGLTVLPTGILQLYSSNLVVARLGDGAQTLSGATGNTLYLDQYTTNGTYLNSIQIPDEGFGLPYGTGSSLSAGLPAGSSCLLFAGGNVPPGNDAGYEAFLGRAPNGLSLSFLGYVQGYPFAGTDVSVDGTNGGLNWRGIGTVDAFGNYSQVWTNSGLYSGGNHQVHSAVDINGNATNYYTCGEAGSGNAIKYCNIDLQPANGSGIAAIAGSLGGTRVAQVVASNLVFTDDGASTIGIYACSGLPNNTATASLVVAETNKPLDFAFSPDLRTLYISDDGAFGGTNARAGGVQRWDASGTGPDGFPGYTYSYTLQMGTASTVGGRALNVDFSAASTWGSGLTGAIVYVTTAETSGNRLLRIVDNGVGSGATTLITAPTNEMLCGARFGPVFVPPGFSIQPQSVTGLFGYTITLSSFAIGTGPLTYQWYFQSNGVGPFTAVTNATNSSYTINSAASNNLGNYYVVVTGPVSSAQSQTVTFTLPATSGVSVAVNTQSPGAVIPTNFLGLSFEEANLKSNGVGVVGYMFDSTNTQLLTLFTNLGIKHLRIGGITVDTNNEVIPYYFPSNQDVDALFRFVRAAGVQVIFSVQLLNGNVSNDVALAAYTWTNYSQYLTALAIGNEPDGYGSRDPQITSFSSYYAKWTTFADAINSAVPAAKFYAPDSAGPAWAADFANADVGSTNVIGIDSHFYFGGDPSSLTPQQYVAGMLSSNWDNSTYPSDYNATIAITSADGFPVYRSTEFNSYVVSYPGVWGGNNVFASALFACDAAHWWAAHGSGGVNFHTFLGKYNATIFYDSSSNYVIFPIGYGQKAFSIGSQGSVIPVTITNTNGLNVTAYGVGSSSNVFVTIINKEYGYGAMNASVTIAPAGITNGTVQAMFLMAANGAFATNSVTLGGAVITNNALFQGQWTPLGSLTNGQCVVTVPITSAAIVQIQAVTQSPPPTLSIQRLAGGQVQLNWNYGVLQSATNATGLFSDLTNATSPATIAPTNALQYYRVRAAQ
jgi:hypothetical protein